MKNKQEDLKVQIIYDYYKQQREEFINLSRERSSLTLQFLIILGALSAAFFQASNDLLKLGITAVMVILGLLGYTILINIEKTILLHVARARKARKSLGFLEEISNVPDNELVTWPGVRNDRYYFRFVFLLIAISGIAFALTVIFK